MSDSTVKYMKKIKTALLAKDSILDPLRRPIEHCFKVFISFDPETPGEGKPWDGSRVCLLLSCED